MKESSHDPPLILPKLTLTILALMLLLSLAGCATTRVNTLAEVPPMHSHKRVQGSALRRGSGSLGRVQPEHVPVQLLLRQIPLPPRGEQLRVRHSRPSSRNGSPGSYNNLGEIRNLTNSLFQLKGEESVTTLGRFVTNSTLGLGGLFDPATSFGLERHDRGFRQDPRLLGGRLRPLPGAADLRPLVRARHGRSRRGQRHQLRDLHRDRSVSRAPATVLPSLRG